jgi:hypothetical protein
MSIHSFLDRFSMGMAGKITRKKYFCEEADSPSIQEWLENLAMNTFPEIAGTGRYPVVFHKEEQPLEAAFIVEQWRGDDFPTIIYHHGAAEGSYDFSFNRILKKNKEAIPANLIAIQALFNHNNQEFMDSIACLSNYAFMLAASARMVEELVQQLHRMGCPRVIVTGVSLGGVVTNIHFTYFHSADRYIPMLAGANIGEVYISSAYAQVASEFGKSKPENLRRALNFEADMRLRDQEKIFPLMAEYDQLIELNVQKGAYAEDRIRLIPCGHATGATKFSLLREHILRGLAD